MTGKRMTKGEAVRDDEEEMHGEYTLRSEVGAAFAIWQHSGRNRCRPARYAFLFCWVHPARGMRVLKLMKPAIFIAGLALSAGLVAGCGGAGAARGDGSARPVTRQSDPAIRDTRARQLFVRGMTKHYLGDIREAIQLFEQALQLSPGEPALLSAMAEAYTMLDDLSTATYYAQQAGAAAPRNVHYQQQLAQLQLNAGNAGQAAETYKDILRRFPEHFEALFDLAGIQVSAGQYREAIATYRQIMDLLGESREVLDQVLQLYVRIEDQEGVERTFRSLIALDPADLSLRRMLSEALLKYGRTDDAVAVLARSLEENPGDFETGLALADLLHEVGRDAQGDSVQAYLLDHPGTSPGQMFNQAVALYRRSLADSAAAAVAADLLTKVLDADSDNTDAKAMLGDLLFRAGSYEKASTLLYDVVQINPRNPDMWYQAAAAFLQAGKARRASDVADEGLTLFPGRLNLLRVASFGLIESYQNRKAIETLNETLQVQAEDAPEDSVLLGEILSALALVEGRLRNQEASDSLYALAIEADPDNSFALNNFAFSLAERSARLDEALELGLRAVANDPENPAFLDTVGWIYFKKKQFAEARDWITRAVDTGRASAAVYEHLGDTYDRLGDAAGARKYWQEALSKNPENMALQTKLEGI